jgi:5-methylcytosine-specific restriction endonuclease McrA
MAYRTKGKVLILNQDYQAIGVCTAQRAFVLVYLRKAEMLSHVPTLSLRSIQSEFRFPSIIRLQRYVSVPYKRVNLSRQNIFKRDSNQCVYCGTREDLTIDHVVPRSAGGKDNWYNLVTACQRCNSKKGNQTPEEAEMNMRHKPFRPSFVMFLGNFSGTLRDDWRPYLYMD